MATITVLYFAATRDVAGADSETFDATGTVADVVRAIEAKHPALAERRAHLRFARNEAFASLDEPVAAGDVIAVIPPVCGG